MKLNTRVPGHELQSEGAAYRTGLGYERPYLTGNPGVGGIGFALCSCGARSGNVNSGNLRKAWHRAHKLEVKP